MACLLAVVGQAWKLSRLSRRAIEKVPIDQAPRLVSQLRYIDRQIEDELQKLGLSVVELDGERFDSGVAASALNAEDFGPEQRLRVAQTLEPVILGRDGVLRYGVVMLGADE
jgi:hypothetical protein